MKPLFCCFFVLATHFAFSQECFIVVSTGGGVSGMVTSYQINPEDGKVLKGSGLGQVTYTEQSKLQKSVARKFYKKTQKLVHASPAFNHPGNMYYAIAATEKGKAVKITWGDSAHPAPQPVSDLFQDIIRKLSEITFSANNTK